jgi:diguanylate cyclase (GGDEF)-like protein
MLGEHGEERRAIVALPFDALPDAVEVLLAQLEARQLGRWMLTRSNDRDLAAAGTAVPIVLPDGSVLGLVQEQPAGSLTPEQFTTVRDVARVMATVLEAEQRADRSHRRALQAEAESMTDSLTGLPNGRAWWRALAREASRCDRHHLLAVVAVVDLDELKVVNDAQGHLAGDLLLRTLAETLENSVRDTDVVARLGGDEFGVLAVDYQAPVPDTLLARLEHSLNDAGIKASVGADVYSPGGNIDGTFKSADLAMYQAKRAHRS